MFKTIKLLPILLLLATTGCVTGVREIALEVPTQTPAAQKSGSIYIASITDSRAFEQKPASPRTPSVKGDLESKTPEMLATYIGRQRNGYGKAMGSVALADGKTVNDEVRALLKEGLSARGYALSDSANGATPIDVDIQKFWAWFVPGFWAVGFESEVALTLSTPNQTPQVVTGAGNNKGQVASDANWQLTYKRAFQDFLNNLDGALEKLGL